MEIADKVLETLKKSNNPLRGGEIAILADLDRQEVDKAIKALKSDNKIASPKRCFYQIAQSN